MPDALSHSIASNFSITPQRVNTGNSLATIVPTERYPSLLAENQCEIKTGALSKFKIKLVAVLGCSLFLLFHLKLLGIKLMIGVPKDPENAFTFGQGLNFARTDEEVHRKFSAQLLNQPKINNYDSAVKFTNDSLRLHFKDSASRLLNINIQNDDLKNTITKISCELNNINTEDERLREMLTADPSKVDAYQAAATKLCEQKRMAYITLAAHFK